MRIRPVDRGAVAVTAWVAALVVNLAVSLAVSLAVVLLGASAASATATPPINQKTVAAEIEAMTGAPAKIAWVRSTDGKMLYLGCGFKDKQDPSWIVMVFDTREGRERPFAPASTPGLYHTPLITPNGERLIWNRGRKDIFIADWDGRHARLLMNGLIAMGVAEDPPGTEWVYVGGEMASSGWPKELYRHRIDKPSVKELVWNKTPDIADKLEISRDGRWAVDGFGRSLALAEFPNGKFRPFGEGCNAGLIFDDNLRVFHMLGGHYGIQLYDNGGSNGRFIRFDDAPGRDGAKAEWWHTSCFHWDPRFLSFSGPWQGPRRDRGNIIVGEFNEDYRSMKRYIRVTSVAQSEIYPYAWLSTKMAPVIATQPSDQTVDEGQQATFTVAARASPSPTYQWQSNGADIPGATEASYTVTAARANKDATFRCVVVNAEGRVRSDEARLGVNLKGPGPEQVKDWDAKLAAFAKDALAAGKKPALSPGSRRNRRAVVSVDRRGTLGIELSPGMQAGMSVAKLSSEEKVNLVLSVLDEGKPADHCLAAFYLLMAGKYEEAESHLKKGGGGAAEVRALFK